MSSLIFNETNTFCISLDKRWNKMNERFQKINLKVTRWKATLPNDITDHFHDYLSPLQKACSQSHIHIWRHIKMFNLDYALIMEDDIFFDKEWRQKLDQFNETNWDLILLNASEPVQPLFTWTKVTEQYLTGAYIISRKGIDNILHLFHNNYSSSDWMTSRLQLFNNSYSYFPWLVIQDGIESTIGSNIDEDHKKVKRCLKEINYDVDQYIQ